MKITATLVNELRQKTGVGIMQCKKALIETEGDVEKAIDLLRKQGAAVAAKRAGKDAKEGRVYLVETEKRAVAFELSCETEPVSKNEDFIALADLAVKVISEQGITSVESLLEASADGVKINDNLQDVLVKIQENIAFRKLVAMDRNDSEVFGIYSHMMGKIGVVTKLAFEGTPSSEEELKRVAKEIAMQVAAFSPVSVNREGLSAETIEKEREIVRAQIMNEGKTKPEFVDRQVDGRVNKTLKEMILEEQEFFITDKNPKKLSVKDYLTSIASSLGLSSLKVVDFTRLERGL
ncbi:MAG: translation elongation factor Ts [Fibrobacter sp.]|jgi:elongation factor Ts|nr:translation elongation factor Ts [Fibrobacter sp.]